MVFGPVIGEVVFARLPVELEEVLCFSVFEPIEPHVHSLGLFWLYFPVDDSMCSGIVGLDWCSALWVAHFF